MVWYAKLLPTCITGSSLSYLFYTASLPSLLLDTLA